MPAGAGSGGFSGASADASRSNLSEIQRRTLANLSIPRNPTDLLTRLSGFVTVDEPVPGEPGTIRRRPVAATDIDALLRGDLAERGWVVKMGEHADPARLASQVQDTRAAMELPDEKAEIYSRRMLRSDLAWRMQGDLWMLSEEGLAELHKPSVDSQPMTPSQVQAAVDMEWARVHHDKIIRYEDDPENATPLARVLLPFEFANWFKQVADDCEARWNVRPRAPMAGGASGYSDAYEVSLIDAENQKTALGAVVDPWFMALSILAFTDADTGTTADNGTHVPTYTGWGRKSVAGTDMPAATSGSGQAANTSAIIFAACTAGSSTILACGNCSTVTLGTLRKWGDVASTVISTTQTPPQFAVGAYVTSAA